MSISRHNRWRGWRAWLLPWPHAVITVLGLAGLVWTLTAAWRWAVQEATFGAATADQCRAAGGACWALLHARAHIILFGSYPSDEYWRPALAVGLMLAVLIASGFRAAWRPMLLIAWLIVALAVLILMAGGVLTLPPVPTSRWGGLPLTVGLSAFGIVLALPLSVLLALGRRAQTRVIRWFCNAYVEIMRGLPLLAVLFVAATMLPLLLPGGSFIDTLIRAQVALVLFQAAYLAEVLRAGIDAVPRGQTEAAQSLGLPSRRIARLVVLPQAFRLALPGVINTFIDAIKDTTLIGVIGLVDVLGGARGAIADGAWMGFYREAFIVVGAAFFVFCYILSLQSRRLEREFARENR